MTLCISQEYSQTPIQKMLIIVSMQMKSSRVAQATISLSSELVKLLKLFAIVHVISAYKNVISIMADRPSRVEALKNKGKDGGLYEVLGMW